MLKRCRNILLGLNLRRWRSTFCRPAASRRCGVAATSQAARPERLISNLRPGGPSGSCDVCVFLP